MTYTQGDRELDQHMFTELMTEIREIRRRLDAHIADEDSQFRDVQKEVSKLREDLGGFRVRLSTITAGISMVVAALVAMVAQSFEKMFV